MSNFTGIAQVDPLFEEAEETTNKQGNRTRKIVLGLAIVAWSLVRTGRGD